MNLFPRLSSWLATTFLLMSLAVISTRAVDPLPPELENAPLEKKADYWQKTSRDSAELKHKVAMERDRVAQAYKRGLLSEMDNRYQAVQASIAAENNPEPTPQGADASGGSSSLGFYLVLAMVIGGGVYWMHRQIREVDQPV